jgi:two-component system response regulator PilR (NtrC family)
VALDQLRIMVQSALRLSAPAAGQARPPARRAQPPDRRVAGDAGAARADRPPGALDGADRHHRRVGQRQGTGGARDPRPELARGKPFIAVNCGAIPEALMEAEFFGYRKGAFTGAADERDGFFQAANGGTLMLDEVADLPLAMQVKLLRAIQERRVRKIGATAEEPVDVRIISATHQDLASASSAASFGRTCSTA